MIYPNGNRVLTAPHAQEEMPRTESGLWLAQNQDERQGAVLADVVAIGPDVEFTEVGNLVLLSQYIGDKVDFKQNFFVIVEEPAILATIDRDADDYDGTAE